MSDKTPRTDEVLGGMEHENAIEFLARQLETELTSALADRDDWKLKALKSQSCTSMDVADLEKKLSSALERVLVLEKALIKIELTTSSIYAQNIAAKALLCG